MNCVKCGTSNIDRAQYCKQCGASLETERDRQDASTAHTAPKPTAAAPIEQETKADPGLPKPPKSVKVLGTISTVFGSMSVLFNIIAPVVVFRVLSDIGGTDPARWVWPLTGILFLFQSLLLLVGGIGMFRGRLWGRKLSLVYAISLFPVAFVGFVAVIVSTAMVQVSGKLGQDVDKLLIFGICGGPIYAIVLMVLLLSNNTKRWAYTVRHGQAPPRDGDPDEQPSTSRLAILSLIFSPLICLPLIAQITAVVMGILALGRIRRSEGRLKGRGLAIAGLVVSVVIILALAGSIIFGIVMEQKVQSQ